MRTGLLLTLTGVSMIMAPLLAQNDLDICYGKGYTLSSTDDAHATGATSYSWYEDGDPLDGEHEESLTIAAGKALGTYAYWRMAANAECPDGIPSNTFTVTVNPVPAIQTASQTVAQGTPISTIIYTASAGAVISLTGSLPPGVNGVPDGTSFVISGTPTGAGTFSYELVSTLDDCASAVTAGTITVVCGGGMTTPPGAVSDQMWCFGTQTWSDRIAANQSSCASTATLSGTNPPPAQYKIYNDNGDTRYYYNWTCVNAAQAQAPATLCPWPWRVPVVSDFRTLLSSTSGSALLTAWGSGGTASGSSVSNENISGYYWSSTQAYSFGYSSSSGMGIVNTSQSYGYQVRCVK